MNPWFYGRVEEFQPLVPDMEHEGITQEEMFKSEASCYTAEVIKISKNKQKIIKNIHKIKEGMTEKEMFKSKAGCFTVEVIKISKNIQKIIKIYTKSRRE